MFKFLLLLVKILTQAKKKIFLFSSKRMPKKKSFFTIFTTEG